MSKGLKVMIPGMIAALILAAVPLAALDLNEIGPQGGIPLPVSNTSRASSGQIGSGIDNYMSYFNYSLPNFNSMFGFGGYVFEPSAYYDDLGKPLVHYYDADNEPVDYFKLGSKIQAGYAFRQGGFYLGVWYKGNAAVAGKESIGITSFDSGTVKTEVAVDSLWTDNQLQLLFGFAGMGIKLGFQEKLEFRSNPVPGTKSSAASPSGTITDRVDDYSFFNGTMVASLGWGMPMAINYMTLCPFLEFSMHFYRDDEDKKITNYDIGVITQDREGRSAGYLAPEGNLGFTLEIPDLEGGTWIPGVSYGIFLPLYNNEYDVFGSSGTVNGTAEWKSSSSNTVTVTTAEIFDMSHSLTPSLAYTRSFIERLELGLSVKVPVTFRYRTEKIEKKDVTRTASAKTYSVDTVQTWISANPQAAVGVGFQAIPDTLNLQTGFSLAMRYEGFSGETSPNSPTTYEKTVSANRLAPLTGRVSAGFSLNFTPEFALDAAFSSGGAFSSGENFSLSASEFSLLFVLKK